MFIRVALLLLLAFSADAFKVEDHHEGLGFDNIKTRDTKKTHQVLKNLWKRYFPSNLKDRKEVPGFEDYEPDLEYRNPSMSNVLLDAGFRDWDGTNEEVVNKMKENTARTIAQALIASTDSFLASPLAMRVLRTVIDPEFFAEICEDGKQLNKYQFLKFLKQSSSQYNFDNFTSYGFEMLESNKRSVHAKAKALPKDSNGLQVEIDYEFKMKLTFDSQYNFSLIYLKQGGSCVNEGQANMDLTGVKDIVAEELEGLKTAPTMKLLFDLFTPDVYKNYWENRNHLPMKWISGLNSSVVKFTVCQEGVDENVPYSIYEFLVWYEKFGIMWYQKPADDSKFIVQVLELTDESISARLTMRLRMGRKASEQEHDWNFKFAGKKINGVWTLEAVNVLCDPSINYKDESLKNYKDVVASTFVHELGYYNDTHWYFAFDFLRSFMKEGQLNLTDCDNRYKVNGIKMSEWFTKDKTRKHGITWTKYHVEEKDAPSPAPDFHTFRFDTAGIMQETGKELEFEWAYEVKWDQKDQFYYIVRMGVGCAKPWTLAKFFEPIDVQFER